MGTHLRRAVGVFRMILSSQVQDHGINLNRIHVFSAVAQGTCWKDYADKSASNAEFLKLSQQVPAA